MGREGGGGGVGGRRGGRDGKLKEGRAGTPPPPQVRSVLLLLQAQAQTGTRLSGDRHPTLTAAAVGARKRGRPRLLRASPTLSSLVAHRRRPQLLLI